MVTIPENYALSLTDPAPQLTINHEVAKDLDSSNAFEGPEKLLEVWFSQSADCLPPAVHPLGLKAVRAEVWEDMLDLVSCKVLSVISSNQMDAYLLSESSMFVFPHKIVLKTCGTTTLLLGLARLLKIAARYAGFVRDSADALAVPHRVFYSRKNFLFPNRQKGPHRSWRDEVMYLDKIFSNGSAYLVGKMNGDHWYLYLTVPGCPLSPPVSPSGSSGIYRELGTSFGMSASQLDGSASVSDDETLEILMMDLDPTNAQQFHMSKAIEILDANPSILEDHRLRHGARQRLEENVDGDWGTAILGEAAEDNVLLPGSSGGGAEVTTQGHILGTVITKTCGLADIYPQSDYPDARIDAYCFEPCGFSANGVIPARPSDAGQTMDHTHYFTVHVTPEPQCSYASFETNVPSSQSRRETRDIIEQVVSIFKPGRFSVTLFEATKAPEARLSPGLRGEGSGSSHSLDFVQGYRRADQIVQGFDGYNLIFRYFERRGFKGGTARIGGT